MYPTQLHSYLLWRSSVEPNPPALASKRYTAAASLVPTVMCGIFVYGWYAGEVLLVSLAAAWLADLLGRRVIYRRERELFLRRDGVWLLTGLLLGLMLPPAIPIYWAAAGAFIAVLAGKFWLQVDGTPLLQPALIGLLALHLLCFATSSLSSNAPGPTTNPMNPRGNWPVLERATSLDATTGRGYIPGFLWNFFGGDIRNSMPRPRSDLFTKVTTDAVTGPRPQDLVAENPARDLSCCRYTNDKGDTIEPYDWLKMLLGYLPGTIGASSGMALLMGIFLLVFSRTQSPLIPLSALFTMLAGFYLV
ncbi:MAG TPA: RnfABCDGE type electron transport complex subunit D, partial [Planctomycetota bacterium]|nr:RnfABCDGE type electron transport complex subunit D [Planctomycetota bacterium]